MDQNDSESTCVFCQIRDRTLEAAWVFEDSEVLAFLDTRPMFDGHVLVVPRAHYRNLFEMPPDANSAVFHQVQRIAEAVKIALGSDGIFVASNNGVSQSVDHVHVHVVPRRKKDGLRGFMWPRHQYESAEVANEIAAQIANALNVVG